LASEKPRIDDGYIWRSKAWLIDGQNVVVKTWANHDFGLVLKLATLSNLACQICGKYFFLDSWQSLLAKSLAPTNLVINQGGP